MKGSATAWLAALAVMSVAGPYTKAEAAPAQKQAEQEQSKHKYFFPRKAKRAENNSSLVVTGPQTTNTPLQTYPQSSSAVPASSPETSSNTEQGLVASLVAGTASSETENTVLTTQNSYKPSNESAPLTTSSSVATTPNKVAPSSGPTAYSRPFAASKPYTPIAGTAHSTSPLSSSSSGSSSSTLSQLFGTGSRGKPQESTTNSSRPESSPQSTASSSTRPLKSLSGLLGSSSTTSGTSPKASSQQPNTTDANTYTNSPPATDSGSSATPVLYTALSGSSPGASPQQSNTTDANTNTNAPPPTDSGSSSTPLLYAAPSTGGSPANEASPTAPKTNSSAPQTPNPSPPSGIIVGLSTVISNNAQSTPVSANATGSGSSSSSEDTSQSDGATNSGSSGDTGAGRPVTAASNTDGISYPGPNATAVLPPTSDSTPTGTGATPYYDTTPSGSGPASTTTEPTVATSNSGSGAANTNGPSTSVPPATMPAVPITSPSEPSYTLSTSTGSGSSVAVPVPVTNASTPTLPTSIPHSAHTTPAVGSPTLNGSAAFTQPSATRAASQPSLPTSVTYDHTRLTYAPPSSSVPVSPAANSAHGASPVSIAPTGTDTATALYVPTSLVYAPSASSPGGLHTQTGSETSVKGMPTTMPALVQPPGGMPEEPVNFTLIQVGFNYGLNWPFVVSSENTTTQIFEFLPQGIAYGLGISTTDVKMNCLLPYDTSSTQGYIKTLAQAYIPSALVTDLEQALHQPNSQLYCNPTSTVETLMSMIDPTIPLIPGTTVNQAGGGSANPYNPAGTTSASSGDGAPIGSDASNSMPVRGTSVGISVGAVCGAAVYAAAMIYLARRYRKKRQRHQRSSSVHSAGEMSQTGSGGMGAGYFMSGANGRSPVNRSSGGGSGGRHSRQSANSSNSRSVRDQGISNPIMAENSLGWN